MDQFLQVVRNLGGVRLAVMAAVLLALAGFFLWLLANLSSDEYALLYADLDHTDAGRVVRQLDADGVPYEVRDDGSAIWVPASRVGPARLALADKGLPAGGSIGYELFDSADTLGVTNFMQNVNLVRALEGELARTIRSIDGVKAARVHLVMPQRELFSREQTQPSASVVLAMNGNRRLSASQVMAVRHLVASAVPGMQPERISVIDDKGTLLAGGFEGDATDPAAMSQKSEEQRRAFENHLAQTIERLLEQTVGPGRVRAEVSAEMDFDRINTSEEIFDPDGQVVRSTQTVEESSASREKQSEPPVSVGNNLPNASLVTGDTAGAESSESRTEETTNYEISRRTTNHVREAGIVNRLSVAVLVDGIYTTDAEGVRQYAPRSADELNQLAVLVRGAIGFEAQRGDAVEVINMRFIEPEMSTDEEVDLMLGLGRDDMLKLAQYIVLVVFALLVILLVVRPLLSRALESMPVPATGPMGDLLVHGSETPALTGPDSPGLGQDKLPADEELEEMIDLERVEGRVRASTVKKVGEIVQKHPDEAIAIIRTWLHEES